MAASQPSKPYDLLTERQARAVARRIERGGGTEVQVIEGPISWRVHFKSGRYGRRLETCGQAARFCGYPKVEA